MCSELHCRCRFVLLKDFFFFYAVLLLFQRVRHFFQLLQKAKTTILALIVAPRWMT